MTKDDIEKLRSQVLGDDPVDAPFEVQYLTAMKRDHETEIKKVQINFRMFEYTLDHGKMSDCKKDIEKLRERVAYFDMRISELSAS